MEWIAMGALVVLAAALALVARSTARRVDSLKTAQASELGRLQDQVDRLQKDNAALSKRLRGLRRLSERNRDGIQDAKDRVAKVRTTVESEQARLVETRTALVAEQARLVETRKLLEHSRSSPSAASALIQREARQTSRREEVERVLLLVTLHRSASTTLFDIFRGHPDVFVEPTASIWAELGLRGRRYPLDLSDGQSCDLAVEVEPGVGALIPGAAGGSRRPHIAIEKAHPQFFDYDAVALAERIRSLQRESRYDISLVYGIRPPLEAMWSMFEYKRRNPHWYRFLDVPAIPGFIERSILAIDELSQAVPGLIVDYDETTGQVDALRSAFSELSPPSVGNEVFDAASQAFAAEVRAASQTGLFVGERPGPRERQGPDGLWVEAAKSIQRAEDSYRRLHDRRGHSWASAET